MRLALRPKCITTLFLGLHFNVLHPKNLGAEVPEIVVLLMLLHCDTLSLRKVGACRQWYNRVMVIP